MAETQVGLRRVRIISTTLRKQGGSLAPVGASAIAAGAL